MMLSELHTVLASSSHRYLADTPTPGNPSLPGGAETQLNSVLGWIKYLGLAAAFVGLFITAGKMAVSHRTGQGGVGHQRAAHQPSLTHPLSFRRGQF